MARIKFVAVTLTKYMIPFVGKSESGEHVNRSITFEPGSRKTDGGMTPAFYMATEEEAKYIREYPTFGEEITEPKPVSEKPKVKPVPVPVGVLEFEEDEEDGPGEDQIESQREMTVFAEISTVQQAGIKLRQLDKSLKTTDLNSREKVLTLADLMDISFPGLK